MTERQKVILKLIKDNPNITANDISLDLSVAKRTIERELSNMQKNQLIRREGSDKTGIWVTLVNVSV